MARGRFPARCPNCGGTEQLLIGQVHHTRIYRRTNLVLSGAVMTVGLSVASAGLRNAELEQLRAGVLERRGGLSGWATAASPDPGRIAQCCS